MPPEIGIICAIEQSGSLATNANHPSAATSLTKALSFPRSVHNSILIFLISAFLPPILGVFSVGHFDGSTPVDMNPSQSPHFSCWFIFITNSYLPHLKYVSHIVCEQHF